MEVMIDTGRRRKRNALECIRKVAYLHSAFDIGDHYERWSLSISSLTDNSISVMLLDASLNLPVTSQSGRTGEARCHLLNAQQNPHLPSLIRPRNTNLRSAMKHLCNPANDIACH